MPEELEECKASVLNDNPDMDESDAYAVCQAQKNNGNLQELSFDKDLAEDDPCWDGYVQVGMKTDENGNEVPNCVPEDDADLSKLAEGCPEGHIEVDGECMAMEDVEGVPPSALDMASPRVLSTRKLRGKIEREELSDGSVVYKNLKILTEGVWTDANSKQPIHYKPGNLELTEENTVNLLHDTDNEVSEVGKMMNDSTEDGAKFVDLKLHMDNAASEYADENLQKALETNGQQGFGGPSVEIPAEGQEIEANGPDGYPVIEDGKIDGLGLVGNQADENVGFDVQTRNRQVALSSPNAKVYTKQDRHMADIDSIRDTMGEAGIDCSEKSDEEVMDMAESLHEDLMDELDMEMGEYGEDEDNDMGEGEDEEEEKDMMDDDALDMVQEELDDLWGELEEMKEEMMGEEMESELSEAKAELAEATETIDTLKSEKEDIEKRLSKVENEPKDPKTLKDGKEDEDRFDWSNADSGVTYDDRTGSL